MQQQVHQVHDVDELKQRLIDIWHHLSRVLSMFESMKFPAGSWKLSKSDEKAGRWKRGPFRSNVDFGLIERTTRHFSGLKI